MKRRGRKPNGARKRKNPPIGILSNTQMISCIESLAFGELGCAILRGFGVKPIEVLEAIQKTDETEAKA